MMILEKFVKTYFARPCILFGRYVNKKLILILSRLLSYDSKLSATCEKYVLLFARATKNYKLQYILAQIFRVKKKYRKAFDIYFDLFKIRHDIKNFTLASICENSLNSDLLYEYFVEQRANFDGIILHIIVCIFSLKYDDEHPDWPEIKSILLDKEGNLDEFVVLLIRHSLFAAFAFKNIQFLESIEKILLTILDDSNEEKLRRFFTILASCYYKLGYHIGLKRLGDGVNYSDSDWQLYMAFGRQEILNALEHRGTCLSNSFFLHYPRKNKSNKTGIKVLFPEKDLCGEAFNGLFYKAMVKDLGRISIICDDRLYDVLASSFDRITFIPKTPRCKVNSEPEKFNKLHGNLSNFLDNASYLSTQQSQFIKLDYKKYYSSEDCKDQIQNGWLIPDPKIVDDLSRKLSTYFDCNCKLVGIASNSTLRSRIRDIHMVGIEYWDEIFELDNCCFINLNAGFSQAQCKEVESQFGVKVYNPEFDLYNDFSELLALMSLLGLAILPANNLMDFAASVALDTLIFSPSNIMKGWANEKNEYVFSGRVKFVFPDNVGDDNYRLVSQCASVIRADFL